MDRRKFLHYASLAGGGFAFAACSQGENANSSAGESSSQASPIAANELLKVGFVYVGPVGDFRWTHAHDSGRREMEANLKGKVVTKYVESVSEAADAERVIRQLAQMATN
jgi:simple sugar transport system substrate-binding protein